MSAIAAQTAAEVAYEAADLIRFARELLLAAGLFREAADTTATVLVEGDLMGHTTHGLALLPGYLNELANDRMTKVGSYTVMRGGAACEAWDANRLPGPWVTTHALAAAEKMARRVGSGTVVIRRSHHIGALAAYLEPIARRGLFAQIHCSDPNVKSVAPFGGVTPVFTPNPFAAGIPTSGDPVLLDISASYTTNGMVDRAKRLGERMPHAWLQDHEGRATDNPQVMYEEPKGTLLPLGGLEAGHKGFALALLVEALTAGLAGFGRADPPEGWGATVFVQVIDPEYLGELAEFTRQMDFVVAACKASKPRPSGPEVRLPGERAQALKRGQLRTGVVLHPTIMPALDSWASSLSVEPPGVAAKNHY